MSQLELALGNGIRIKTSAKPLVVSVLTATTTYDVYVRQGIGDNIYSNFAGPTTFTTYGIEIDFKDKKKLVGSTPK